MARLIGVVLPPAERMVSARTDILGLGRCRAGGAPSAPTIEWIRVAASLSDLTIIGRSSRRSRPVSSRPGTRRR